jgi:mannose/fructose-specific phosphotransferase system component IIA
MTPTTGVIVAHANLASALVEAAESISGIRGVLHPVSNDGLSPQELMARVEAPIGRGPAIVFTDLASGSCTFAGRAVGRGSGAVVVVTGVSLPMLVDFLFNRDMQPEELARRVVEKAKSGAAVIAECGDGNGA